MERFEFERDKALKVACYCLESIILHENDKAYGSNCHSAHCSVVSRKPCHHFVAIVISKLPSENHKQSFKVLFKAMDSVPQCRQRSCMLLQVYTYAQRPKGRTREQIDIAVDAFARLSIGNVLSASGTKPIVQPLPVISALLLFCNLCIEPKYESDSGKSFVIFRLQA